MSTNSTHTLQRVHGRLDEALSQELIEFWTAQNAVPDGEFDDRLPTVLSLLRNADGDIVGVSSARSTRLALFANQPFHVFRYLLTREAAEASDWLALLLAGCEILDERANAPDHSGEIGMLVRITQLKLQQAWPEAIWPQTGLVHAGFTEQGHQLRVRYYQDARIDMEARA